jgi:hypothetical protein
LKSGFALSAVAYFSLAPLKRPHFGCELAPSLLLVVFDGFLQVFLMHIQEFWDTKTLIFAQIAG